MYCKTFVHVLISDFQVVNKNSEQMLDNNIELPGKVIFKLKYQKLTEN